MKYEKGTFITVPNRHVLSGLDPQTQVLYVWLCSYADENGVCFPSISRLSRDCGMSRDTVLRRFDVLESNGLVHKEHRYKNNEKTSNQYQLLLVGSSCERLPQSHTATTPSRSQRHRTKTNRTKTSELSTEHSSGEIVTVIDAFREWNPAAKTWYGRKPYREAIQRLLDEYGLEMVCRVVAALPQTNQQRFFPSITTPIALEQKWKQLEAAYSRYKQDNEINVVW